MKKIVVALVIFASSLGWAGLAKPSIRGRNRMRNNHGSLLFQKADFQQDWERYPAPDATIQELARLFPRVTLPSGDDECRTLTDNNRSLLGDNNPVTGYASVNQPNSSFISWYNGCLIKYLTLDSSVRFAYQNYDPVTGQSVINTVQNFKTSMIEYLGKNYSAVCKLPDSQTSLNAPNTPDVSAYQSALSSCSWRNLSRENQLDIIKHNILLLIGPPEVLIDLGIETKNGELAQKIMDYIERASLDREFNISNLTLSFNDDSPTPGQRSLQVLSAAELARFLILQTSFIKY